MNERFVGLISGTSADGIDAALVTFDPDGRLAEAPLTLTLPYPTALRRSLIQCMRRDAALPLDRLGQLDQQVGLAFSAATLTLLEEAKLSPSAIHAIGSHGQTLFHAPDAGLPHTLQIGDPNQIAAGTGIPVVADFRRADMVAGGQGAPLAPGLHAALWRCSGITRAVINLGGIANVTTLPGDPGQAVTAYDSGPANCLLDLWHSRHRGGPVDTDGEWARTGKPVASLLSAMLADSYFSRPAPKSTGREYFDGQWLDSHLGAHLSPLPPEDVQATLLALTIETVAQAIETTAAKEAYVCGGGAHNSALLQGLRMRMPGVSIAATDTLGLPADDVEAVAFAWLAMRHTRQQAGNLPSVTGARYAAILGGRYLPPISASDPG
ncbi:anhydro-N-acetylmuramic acid kinase [Abyssibacter profundi]|uniref:Anhydro-N-acetylmuramic acid kinase n=1 Tax=Abyssibacter profundi TaxID=2182787 RepID=A0A363UKM4_9GAMM|nr:anhydro-N-acetylmuramic acid kinase [Abyssibacter profundi]PWN55971.1 anhydro-N-acetylmuramic acid kinase [Abyssibacter profundi]